MQRTDGVCSSARSSFVWRACASVPLSKTHSAASCNCGIYWIACCSPQCDLFRCIITPPIHTCVVYEMQLSFFRVLSSPPLAFSLSQRHKRSPFPRAPLQLKLGLRNTRRCIKRLPLSVTKDKDPTRGKKCINKPGPRAIAANTREDTMRKPAAQLTSRPKQTAQKTLAFASTKPWNEKSCALHNHTTRTCCFDDTLLYEHGCGCARQTPTSQPLPKPPSETTTVNILDRTTHAHTVHTSPLSAVHTKRPPSVDYYSTYVWHSSIILAASN